MPGPTRNLLATSWYRNAGVVVATLGLLYLFLVSIGLIGASFKLLGKDLALQIFGIGANPVDGLLIGILATSLVQSSSTTTSIVVGMVAAGLPVQTAIPMIMGANIGTSVTNSLVSLGQVGRTNEFQRAFAAATVHDFFNLLAVVILFPLQYYTNFLGVLSGAFASLITAGAEVTFNSPLKAVVGPAVKLLVDAFGAVLRDGVHQAVLLLLLAGVMLFVSLKNMTRLLGSVVMSRASGLFQRTLFRSAPIAFVVGIALTVAVQSSSITTSLVVPLAGAGILTLAQIYPYTLGTNLGTTVTALLASLAAENFGLAVTVALSHLLFNLCGVAIMTATPGLRTLPLRLAEGLAAQARHRPWVAIGYIVGVFFLLPAALLYFGR